MAYEGGSYADAYRLQDKIDYNLSHKYLSGSANPQGTATPRSFYRIMKRFVTITPSLVAWQYNIG